MTVTEPDDLAPVLLNRMRAVRDGCRTCRQDLLEMFGHDPAAVAEMAFWVCSHVMDTYNDIPVEMLERGDPGFRRLVLAYCRSTFKDGFYVRELVDMYEVARHLAPSALQRAAERALDVLMAETG